MQADAGYVELESLMDSSTINPKKKRRGSTRRRKKSKRKAKNAAKISELLSNQKENVKFNQDDDHSQNKENYDVETLSPQSKRYTQDSIMISIEKKIKNFDNSLSQNSKSCSPDENLLLSASKALGLIPLSDRDLNSPI